MGKDGKNHGEGGHITRRQLIGYASAAGFTTALAGCSGEEPEETTDNGLDDSDDASLVYATTISPSTIDPMRASDNFENIYTVNVYDSLLNYTDDSPPQLEAGLATDWEVSDDEQTYEFTLRDDATFHNGDPVTASDVAYSFERMQELQDGLSWMWDGTIEPEGVTAIDETTVEIETERTFAPFLFTLPYHPIVNEAEVEENDEDWLEQNDAGSGPYELVEHEREERIVLERADDWWGDDPAGEPFEEVTLEIVPEEGTVNGMMGDGSADITDEWLSVESYEELDDLDHVWVSDEVTFSPLYVFMHTQREPLDDVNVRRAISYAVDYQQIVDDILLGNADQMQGPLPAEMWGHNDDAIQYEQDIDQAQEYLDESDHDPEDIELTYTYVTGLTVTENIGLLLQTNLNELGIDLELEAAPWTRITDMTTSQDTTSDMHAIYLSFSYVDPDTFLYPAWHSSSHGSWESAAWYENDEVDQLLDDARTEVDVDQRTEYYEEAQEIIAEEAPALFLVNEAELYGVNERIGGYVDNGLVGYSKAFWRLYEES
ncbi:ABC transporter substrate-binding protein [Halobiforma nitratireducens]|uniref:Peptide ABC transporter substrate-binding protein n=1 Tax=Halobiforma nitratireducens JCM 10879 TaxID=1227454 RepID=M0MR11_9EURY|nr:ABC transporter substrate-binding protein [Halobiforma nitratireducens]EMA47184.1 peptide ABC transporter substrate-binding protein [Halobiforma nitratireducens JCM 10879]